MRWICKECKRPLGRVVRIVGQKARETRVDRCPFCKKNTEQCAGF